VRMLHKAFDHITLEVTLCSYSGEIASNGNVCDEIKAAEITCCDEEKMYVNLYKGNFNVGSTHKISVHFFIIPS
jgi:hypothetical protein